MFLKIAGFNFDIKNQYYYITKRLGNYCNTDFNKKVDYSFSNSKEDIEKEYAISEEKLSLAHAEISKTLRTISEWLPNRDAFVLHSATFDVDGVGVAFAARSGTGKSTHMFLWQKLLGDRMTVVNGDKPIVRFFDDEPDCPYAYGTPWNGKEKLGCNMRTPLKHICFIERAKENSVEKVEAKDAINRILNQVYMPKNPVALAKTIELINRLINCCNFWQINCNMEPEAAEVAYNAIFGKNQ